MISRPTTLARIGSHSWSDKKMRKSTYLSHSVWNSIDPEVRRAILSVIPHKRTEFIGKGKFVSWLINELQIQGEHELAVLVLGDDIVIGTTHTKKMLDNETRERLRKARAEQNNE